MLLLRRRGSFSNNAHKTRKKATKPNSKYICDRLFSLQKYGILVNPTSIYGILVNPTSIKILGILVNPTAKIYKDIR